MSKIKTYKGGCHSGAVRFEAELDLESPAGEIGKPDAYALRSSSTAALRPQ